MSTTLASGANTTITLPAGQVLYTGKTGNGQAVVGPGPQAGQTFALGTGARIGPYGNDVSVFLTSTQGAIEYQIGSAPGVPAGNPIALDPLGPTIPVDGAAAVGLSQVQSTAYRRNARRRNSHGDLIPAPTWSATEAVVAAASNAPRVRQIRRKLASGQILLLVTGGTTGATEPTFSATSSIADGTAVWVADGTVSRTATPFPAPTVTTYNGAAVPAGYTEYFAMDAGTLTNNTARFLEVGQTVIPYQPTLNGGPQGGGASQAYSHNMGASNDPAGFNFNPGGVLQVGLDCKQRVVHFTTESSSPIITIWATGGTRNWLHEVRKTGTDEAWYRLEGSPTLTPAVGTQIAGTRLTPFNPEGAFYDHRLTMGADMPFRGVAVEATATVRATVQSGVYLHVYGDSTWDTTSSYESAPWDVGGLRFARAFGADYLRQMNKGGTGYVNTGTGTGSPFYTVGQMIANNVMAGDVPHYSVIMAGYNDASFFTTDPVGLRASIKSTYQTALRLYPTTQWLVIEPWTGREDAGGAGQTTKGAQLVGIAQMIASVIAEIASPMLLLVKYTTKNGGCFTTGTGRWGALTAVGNADKKVGADAIHHSPVGRQQDFGGCIPNECDLVAASVGR